MVTGDVRMKFVSVATLAAFIAWGHPVWAQDIYERCSAAREAGDTDTVVDLAETIQRFTTHPAVRERSAELCVTAAKGYRVQLDLATGAFLNDTQYEALLEERTVEAETKSAGAPQAIINATTAVAAKEASRLAVMKHTVDACRELYDRDWVQAMTSNVCQPVFMELGLPD